MRQGVLGANCSELGSLELRSLDRLGAESQFRSKAHRAIPDVPESLDNPAPDAGPDMGSARCLLAAAPDIAALDIAALADPAGTAALAGPGVWGNSAASPGSGVLSTGAELLAGVLAIEEQSCA